MCTSQGEYAVQTNAEVSAPSHTSGLMAFLFDACAKRLRRLRGQKGSATKGADTEEVSDLLTPTDSESNVPGSGTQDAEEDAEQNAIGSSLGSNQFDQTGSLNAYFRVIHAVPKMTIEDEQACIARYRQGDMAARDDLICANLWLVPLVTRRMAHRGVPFEDLVEEGNLGLFKAVERFDPSVNVRFSTYAKWWIIQAASLAISAHAYPVRVPSSVAKDMTKLHRARRHDDSRADGSHSRVHEVRTEERWSDSYISLLSSISEPPVALETFMEHDELKAESGSDGVNDLATSPDVLLAFKESLQQLTQAIDGLDDRSRTVLMRRFGLDNGPTLTLQELGAMLGLSAERVRVIQESAIQHLRARLENTR